MKREPIRAWAVVCGDGSSHYDRGSPWLWFHRQHAEHDKRNLNRTRNCGPHHIVELVERRTPIRRSTKK